MNLMKNTNIIITNISIEYHKTIVEIIMRMWQ